MEECQAIEDKESLRVKLLSHRAFLPIRASQGSAGFDVRATKDYTIGPNEQIKIPLELSIFPPKGCYTQVASRSSMVMKNVFTQGGIIDSDYTGDLIVILCNKQDRQYSIKRGDKIAQLILHRIATPTISTVNSLPQTQRSFRSFGSSDSQINPISVA